VKLVIFDVSGRAVRTLINSKMTAGRHAVAWDGTDAYAAEVPAGVYFLSLAIDGHKVSTKVVLQK
jgi:flagellar hook assembly protein FlgD